MEQRAAGVAVGRVDEPARRKGRQSELVRAALGGQAPVHDGERTLGVGAVDASREREVSAQPVVAGLVVELVGDAQEALVGAQLERGHDRDSARSSSERSEQARSSPIAHAGHV